jgi:hypothetical protein
MRLNRVTGVTRSCGEILIESTPGNRVQTGKNLPNSAFCQIGPIHELEVVDIVL